MLPPELNAYFAQGYPATGSKLRSIKYRMTKYLSVFTVWGYTSAQGDRPGDARIMLSRRDADIEVKVIKGITRLEFMDEVDTLADIVRRLLPFGLAIEDLNGTLCSSSADDLRSNDPAPINDVHRLAQQWDEHIVVRPEWRSSKASADS